MIPFNKLIKTEKLSIIGMIHVAALPGTPSNILSPNKIIKKALEEARIYKETGINIVMIENMHDTPYLKSAVGHEISTIMAIIGYEIKKQYNLYCGIQILAGANEEALAAAYSAGLDFIRVEGYVYGHMADEGLIESCAAKLLRYRKQIGAQEILIFSDIKKKHSSHAITNDTSIADHANAAKFFLADAIIITGQSTGIEANIEEIKDVKNCCDLPLIIGSGITASNIGLYSNHANGLIIGSYFKEKGDWRNPLDRTRIKKVLKVIKNDKKFDC